MIATTARKISFAINGIHYGTGRLWDSILIDTAIIWSTDPQTNADINADIECAIRRGHDAICYTDDSGQRTVITWRTEQ